MLHIAYCVANIIRHCEVLRAHLEMRRSKSFHINKYKIVCKNLYVSSSSSRSSSSSMYMLLLLVCPDTTVPVDWA